MRRLVRLSSTIRMRLPASAGALTLQVLGRHRRRRDSHRQLDPEGRTAAGHALDPDLPTHQLGEPLADGQPEPGAAVLARGRSVDLRERLEQLRQVLGRDADAGVAHGNAQRALLAVACTHVDGDEAPRPGG
jgi:hypothetical protein